MANVLPVTIAWVEVWRTDGGNGPDLSTDCIAPDGTREAISVSSGQVSALVNDWMATAMLSDPKRFLPSPP